MEEIVEAIVAAALKNQVKIMIGDGRIDEQVEKCTVADAYGKDAMEAVAIAQKWTALSQTKGSAGAK